MWFSLISVFLNVLRKMRHSILFIYVPFSKLLFLLYFYITVNISSSQHACVCVCMGVCVCVCVCMFVAWRGVAG